MKSGALPACPPEAVSTGEGRRSSWRRLGRALLLHGLLRPLARKHLRDGRAPLAVMSFDLIGSTIQVHGRWEGELLDLLGAYAAARVDLADGLYIDVGANIGTTALAMAPYFRQTLAFEPHPVLSQLLRINGRREPKIDVIELALSDQAGQAELTTMEDNQGGSSLAGPGPGAASAGSERSHRVSCATLDSVLASRSEHKVSMIKIDIEGHEAAALRGMQQTLARWSPVVVLEQAAGQFAGGSSDSIDLLRQAGYAMFWVPTRNLDLGPGLWRGALAGLLRCLVGTRLSWAPCVSFAARDHDMILAIKPAPQAEGDR